MEATAYFEDITRQIQTLLSAAEHEIVVAVAWFTDRMLFDALCKKAALGVSVQLALLDDRINRQARINLPRLEAVGGKVHRIPAPVGAGNIMHHKFCVIDEEIVITGSYNWSQRAKGNDENITVIRNSSEIASQYLNAFDDLLAKHGLVKKVEPDTVGTMRRLEVIRNLILLDELDSLPGLTRKLRPLATVMNLQAIMTTLDKGDHATVVSLIEDYLNRGVALVTSQDIEIPALQIELRSLEIQLNTLSDEKTELEHIIHTFIQRHNRDLGELLTEYLRLRAENLKLKAKTQQEKEQEAAEADKEYEHYRKSYEAARKAPPIQKFKDEEQREIKALYRRASQLCHPDKVAEADKQKAHKVFQELQHAYRDNDLNRLRAILEYLQHGDFFASLSESTTKVSTLKRAVKQLRDEVAALSTEIAELRRGDIYHMLKDLTDWDVYFTEQQKELEKAITNLKA